MFWDNFVNLCDQQKKSPNKVASEIGCSSGSITAWKQGRLPRKSTLVQIADYFDVTVEELLGKNDATELAAEMELSSQEERLIEAFRSADDLGKLKIIQFVMNESDRSTVKMVADNKNSIPPIVRKKPRHT